MCKYYIYMVCPEYSYHSDSHLTTSGGITWEDIQTAKDSFRKEAGIDKDSAIFIVHIYKLERE